MNLQLMPGKLRGTVHVPPSKSLAHRYILGAALAEGTSTLKTGTISQDIGATLRCAEALGAKIHSGPGALMMTGIGSRQRGELPLLPCGASGSTLRFLMPLSLVLGGGGRFLGEGMLLERPMGPYLALFQEKGIAVQPGNPLTIEGRLPPGSYSLPGNVSSQFFTGLLLALPLLEGDSLLEASSPVESRPYIDLTLDVLREYGVSVEEPSPGRFLIPGRQTYHPLSRTIEGDWSQAGFWYAANALGSSIRVLGLRPDSRQQDRALAESLPELAAQVPPRTIDLRMHPDMALPLAPWAACQKGETVFTGCSRLRYKESDRLEAILSCIRALGGEVRLESPDELRFFGQPHGLQGGVTIQAQEDHRIAMMAAVAATVCREPITLIGAECVKKSYPDFWRDYTLLGGKIHEYTGK